jgi:hypothetical protein
MNIKTIKGDNAPCEFIDFHQDFPKVFHFISPLIDVCERPPLKDLIMCGPSNVQKSGAKQTAGYLQNRPPTAFRPQHT